MLTDTEKLKRLEAFLAAAKALDEDFTNTDPLLNCGYPEFLPSFDEFISDLVYWRDQVKACVKPKCITAIYDRDCQVQGCPLHDPALNKQVTL